MVPEQRNNVGEMVSALSSGRMTRRTFLERAGALGLSASAAAAFLAACGEPAGSTTSGPITLTLWDYFNPPGDGYLGIISDYMKANPSIKIQRTVIPFADLKQKLIQGAASKQLPDIAVIDNPDHSAFADLGVLADITSQVTTWGQADQYFPGPWNSTVWKGKNYGIPNNSNCLALYYNKDLFQKAGLKPPTTWDEMHSAATALTKNGVYGLSMSLIKSEEGTFQFLSFLWEAGADLNTIDSAAGVSALQYLVTFAKAGLLSSESLNWTQQDAITQFIAGKAAMCINGPWNLPVTQQGAKFSWGVVPLPKGKQSASILGGENWAITVTSPHIKEAWDFISWTQLPAQMKAYILKDQRLPSRKDLANDPAIRQDPNLSVFVDSFAFAKPRAYGPNYPKISNAVQQAFQSAISGQTSAENALKQAAVTIKPLMA
ncbi:MAG TPA: sugar ABC transporter substrate-binding protein [Ktedonobacteraceae bacterium]|jgi:multiple sugar transport system substrate-binding protein|nr:sugar ABC transporter substrate-binding protein [Ktedonobacteraceae bacterium]